MDAAEQDAIPQLTTEELIQHVFRDEYGEALIKRWLSLASITHYKQGSKDHETLIRQDELQRFMFSIISAMSYDEQQLFILSQQRAEAVNQQRIANLQNNTHYG